MNNITIFISLLITIYTLYYICKTQKYLETFTDISSIDNGDIITPSTETATDLIERNEVDYNDSIYTTKYLFTNKGNKLKTKQEAIKQMVDYFEAKVIPKNIKEKEYFR